MQLHKILDTNKFVITYIKDNMEKKLFARWSVINHLILVKFQYMIDLQIAVL